jgi:hypothetical protein
MNDDDDDLLLDGDSDDASVDDDEPATIIPTSVVDVRRMIERRMELKRLREDLDDPEFNFEY